MRTHDVLHGTASGGAATGSPAAATALHLGQTLRAADIGTLLARAVSVSAGTLDGMLASIHVGDVGTLVAYRDEAVDPVRVVGVVGVLGAVGCPS